jgi:bifunctional enzyme CysN/CysC
MPWYEGPSLLEHLERCRSTASARMRRQAVPHAGAVGQPPNQDFRGFAGLIAAAACAGRRGAGAARPGTQGRGRRIVTSAAISTQRVAGQSVTLTSPTRSTARAAT